MHAHMHAYDMHGCIYTGIAAACSDCSAHIYTRMPTYMCMHMYMYMIIYMYRPRARDGGPPLPGEISYDPRYPRSYPRSYPRLYPRLYPRYYNL